MVETLYLFDSSLDYTVTSTKNFRFKIEAPLWSRQLHLFLFLFEPAYPNLLWSCLFRQEAGYHDY